MGSLGIGKNDFIGIKNIAPKGMFNKSETDGTENSNQYKS